MVKSIFKLLRRKIYVSRLTLKHRDISISTQAYVDRTSIFEGQ